MELSQLLLTGALSGLVSVLAHSVVWSVIDLLRPQSAALKPYARLDIPDVLLHLWCGVTLGLMFWLSWGLAAVVDVSWWVRGLYFGGLCWLGFAAPAIISLAIIRGTAQGSVAVIASRWATTCFIAGLACAWSWEGRM